MTNIPSWRKAYTSLFSSICLLWSLCFQNVIADTAFPGDLLLFPSIQYDSLSGSGVAANTDKSLIEPAVSVFYSYEEDEYLALIEFFLNNEESEFERLQLGWYINDNTRLWFGRFHNPLGYWNTAFHHGAYLQTSSIRPAIAEFEDDGGVIPIHVSGLLFENEKNFSDGRLNINFALGTSPTMETGTLEAMEIFSPGGETYHENITLRLSYYPDVIDETHIGVFAGYSRIEADGVISREIVQTQAGFFGLWKNNQWQVLSSIFFIDNNLKSATAAADLNGDFINAYVQLDYAVDEKWVAYTRIEESFNHEADPYLALIPAFIDERKLAGLRYDLSVKQALTVEIRQDNASSGTINHVILQWSALLP